MIQFYKLYTFAPPPDEEPPLLCGGRLPRIEARSDKDARDVAWLMVEEAIDRGIAINAYELVRINPDGSNGETVADVDCRE